MKVVDPVTIGDMIGGVLLIVVPFILLTFRKELGIVLDKIIVIVERHMDWVWWGLGVWIVVYSIGIPVMIGKIAVLMQKYG